MPSKASSRRVAWHPQGPHRSHPTTPCHYTSGSRSATKRGLDGHGSRGVQHVVARGGVGGGWALAWQESLGDSQPGVGPTTCRGTAGSLLLLLLDELALDEDIDLVADDPPAIEHHVER